MRGGQDGYGSPFAISCCTIPLVRSLLARDREEEELGWNSYSERSDKSGEWTQRIKARRDKESEYSDKLTATKEIQKTKFRHRNRT